MANSTVSGDQNGDLQSTARDAEGALLESAFEDFFVTSKERHDTATAYLGSAFDHGSTGSELQQLLAFWIADEEYAVDINEIQEIVKVPPITEVPRVNPCVLGITSLRGTIVPILDLRRSLNLQADDLGRDARVLVMRAGGDPVGFLVDRVTSVVRVGLDDIEPTPATMQRATSDMVLGVGRLDGQLLIVLDVEAALTVMERVA